MMVKMHYKTIAERNRALGLPEPQHPLFDIAIVHCNADFSFRAEFFTVSYKKVIKGEVVYGRTKYDCQSGTMVFTGSNQEITTNGIVVETDIRSISFHKDFLLGHELATKIGKYHFFNYAVNEALHLSEKEEKIILSIFDAIDTEYHNNYDEFSRALILSHLDTLLKYANRFYHRQFLMRKEAETDVYSRFMVQLEAVIEKNLKSEYASLPQIEEIAGSLNYTARYLSDALRAETGKTAKHWIQLTLLDKAKELLLASDESVSNIAYMLGFEYPQYFSRLFKNKLGISPKEFRKREMV